MSGLGYQESNTCVLDSQVGEAQRLHPSSTLRPAQVRLSFEPSSPGMPDACAGPEFDGASVESVSPFDRTAVCYAHTPS
jgi:hypothetical protein